MDRVMHFEIPADKMDRALKFYSKTFGWKMAPVKSMEDQYVIAQTAEVDKKTGAPITPGAINGGIGIRDKRMSCPDVVIGVKDIDAKLKKIKAAGGKAVTKKMPVMDMGFTAYFKDTEGNIVGLWQDK